MPGVLFGVASGAEELAAPAGVQVKDAEREQIARSAADVVVVREGGRERVRVRQVEVVDEAAQVAQQAPEPGDLLGRDGFRAAADHERSDTRQPAAEDRTGLVGLAANRERADVVIGQRGRGGAGDHVGRHVSRQPGRVVQQAGRGVVDVVEDGQVVKVQQVRVDEVRPEHQVAQDAAVVRRRDTEGVIEAQARRQRVRDRAHAADALGVGGGVARVAAEEDDLEAAEHRAGTLGADDLLLARDQIDGHLDGEVSLDARYGINGDRRRHLCLL